MKQQLSKTISSYTNLIVDFGIDYNKGNNNPHFSITGEVTYRGKTEICGCIHDEIEKHTGDKFKDLIALHLSDHNGIPMYPLANGFYHYENKNIEHLSSHLRISIEDAQTLSDKLDALDERFEKKVEFKKFVVAQLPRWKKEAQEAIKNHSLEVPTFPTDLYNELDNF